MTRAPVKIIVVELSGMEKYKSFQTMNIAKCGHLLAVSIEKPGGRRLN